MNSTDQREQSRIIGLDLVGIREIAERAGVQVSTVNDWRGQSLSGTGTFPTENLTVSRTPLWTWRRVEKWLTETGRLTS